MSAIGKNAQIAPAPEGPKKAGAIVAMAMVIYLSETGDNFSGNRKMRKNVGHSPYL
jgi:hypothetical protein